LAAKGSGGQPGEQTPHDQDEIQVLAMGAETSFLQSSNENEFNCEQDGSVIIITHVKSDAKISLRCEGTFTFRSNILCFEDKCYLVMYENKTIILEHYKEVLIQPDEVPDDKVTDDQRYRHSPSDDKSTQTLPSDPDPARIGL